MVVVKMNHNSHLVDHHTGPEVVHMVNHSRIVALAMNITARLDADILTNAPGLGANAGLWAAPGVLSPLLPSLLACSAIRALCSANRFLSSDGDSNFGFLACPPALEVPGPGLPVAARRSASA